MISLQFQVDAADRADVRHPEAYACGRSRGTSADSPDERPPHRLAQLHAWPALGPPCCTARGPRPRWYGTAEQLGYRSCPRHRRSPAGRRSNRRSTSKSLPASTTRRTSRSTGCCESQRLPSGPAGSSSSSSDSLDDQSVTSPRPIHRCSRETALRVSIERFAAIRTGRLLSG